MSQVGVIRQLLGEALEPIDRELVRFSTSERLSELREVLDAQLSGSGQRLVSGLFLLTGALVATVLLVFTQLTRKSFGRRRALGATRALIVRLVLVQTALLTGAGGLLGSLLSMLALLIGGVAHPPVSFPIAVSVLTVVVSCVCAVLPAVLAARRDPVRELRVP